jgi:hypothetical protein
LTDIFLRRYPKWLAVRFSGAAREGGLSRFAVAIARGKHLFPFRTEQLSLSAPMVLGPQGPGRVGRRRFTSHEPLPRGRLVVVVGSPRDTGTLASRSSGARAGSGGARVRRGRGGGMGCGVASRLSDLGLSGVGGRRALPGRSTRSGRRWRTGAAWRSARNRGPGTACSPWPTAGFRTSSRRWSRERCRRSGRTASTSGSGRD